MNELNVHLADTAGGIVGGIVGGINMREGCEQLNVHVAVAQASQWPDGAEHAALRYPSIRVLLSYHYYKTLDFDRFRESLRPMDVEVFIDSGAFSAHTQGATIKLDEYASFLHKNQKHINVMASLDDLSSPEKSRKNHLKLVGMGLPVIPCFHVGEPFSYLEKYLEEHDYIALGGMVPHMRSRRDHVMRWLVQCFKLAKGYPGRGYHGFGCTSWKVVSSFPWRSVDSSSWGAGFRFGTVPLFDQVRGTWHTIQLGDTSSKQLDPVIRRYGFEYRDFADRARNNRRANAGLALASWLEAEKWLTRRHGTGGGVRC